jgi:hypothetical protein
MYIIWSLYILLSNNIALEFQVLPDLRFFYVKHLVMEYNLLL